MTVINDNGKNLSIIIDNHQSWASFALWYSINRHLPEADVILLRKRSDMETINWPFRVHIPISYNINFTILKQFLVLDSWHLCLRNLNGYELPQSIGDCRNKDLMPFVKITECGNFSKDLWCQHEKRPAFSFVKNLRKNEMTINEIKVFDLWEEMKSSFDIIEI